MHRQHNNSGLNSHQQLHHEEKRRLYRKQQTKFNWMRSFNRNIASDGNTVKLERCCCTNGRRATIVFSSLLFSLQFTPDSCSESWSAPHPKSSLAASIRKFACVRSRRTEFIAQVLLHISMCYRAALACLYLFWLYAMFAVSGCGKWQPTRNKAEKRLYN